jgi:arsenate reductase (thioredoxin)
MKPVENKKKVLFYCRHNATCSQIAEAFLKLFFPEAYEGFSAGTIAAQIHPAVKTVMAEIGVDVSKQRSKNVEEFVGTRFDCVAIVCGNPSDECPFLHQKRESLHCKKCQGCCRFFPFFPQSGKVIRARFQDPARFSSSENENMESFRKLRDDIKGWVIETFGRL